MLAELTTYVADVKRRILTQYLKPKITGLLEVFAAEAQELEGALWDLLLSTSIGYFGPPVPPGEETTSPQTTGVWLDFLGTRVGATRDGDGDAIFATTIAARVLANRSKGTIPNLIDVIELASLGVAPSAFDVKEVYPAGLELQMGMEFALETAERVARLVRRARAAAIGVMLFHHIEHDDLTFTFSPTSSPVASTFQGFRVTIGDPSTGGSFAGVIRA